MILEFGYPSDREVKPPVDCNRFVLITKEGHRFEFVETSQNELKIHCDWQMVVFPAAANMVILGTKQY